MPEREYGNDFLLLAGSYHKPRILYLELTISIVRVLMDHFNLQFSLASLTCIVLNWKPTLVSTHRRLFILQPGEPQKYRYAIDHRNPFLKSSLKSIRLLKIYEVVLSSLWNATRKAAIAAQAPLLSHLAPSRCLLPSKSVHPSTTSTAPDEHRPLRLQFNHNRRQSRSTGSA